MTGETTDYHSQLVTHEADLTSEEKRAQLVAQLEKGIVINLGSDKVTFISKKIPLPTTSQEISRGVLIGIDVMVDGRKIAWVEAEWDNQQFEVSKLTKHYDENVDSRFQQKGLITLSTGLLFQVLEQDNITKVIGKIEVHNTRSLRSRLNVRDLVLGGYYNVVVQKLPSEVPAWRKTDKEYYTVTTVLDGSRRDTPLSIVDALKDTFE